MAKIKTKRNRRNNTWKKAPTVRQNERFLGR